MKKSLFFSAGFCKSKKLRAQGAIEYLLLLAAAIIVVSIVVTFMVTTLDPAKDTGNEETFNYLCNTLDSNTADCTCYKGNNDKGYFPTDGYANAEDYCCESGRQEILQKKWDC